MANSFAFISYFREDYESVRHVLQAFDQAGIPYWIDDLGMEIGEQWERKITRKIEEASAFVVFFSKSYYERPQSYVREELRIAVARMRQFDPSVRWLLPICLDDIALPKIAVGPGRDLAASHAIYLDSLKPHRLHQCAQQVREILLQPQINLASIRLTTAHLTRSPMVLISGGKFDFYGLENPHTIKDVKLLRADGTWMEFSVYWDEYFELFWARRHLAKSDNLSYARSLRANETVVFNVPPGAFRLQIATVQLIGITNQYGSGWIASSTIYPSNALDLRLEARQSAALLVQDTPATGFLWRNRPTKHPCYLTRID